MVRSDDDRDPVEAGVGGRGEDEVEKGRPAIGIIALWPASAARCWSSVRTTPGSVDRIRVPRPRARMTARVVTREEGVGARDSGLGARGNPVVFRGNKPL